jgi:predicted MFS family arabinose efflux permease
MSALSVLGLRKSGDDRVPFLLLLALLDMCSVSTGNITPIMLGLLVERAGLSERMAGFAISAETVGYIAGLAAFNIAIGRCSRVTLTRAGAALIGLGSVLTLLLHGSWIIGARLIYGAGVGVVLALLFNAVSARAAPQRDYAALSAITLVYSAVLLFVCGALARSSGLYGVCALICVHSVVGFVIAGWIPDATALPASARRSADRARPAVRFRVDLAALSAAVMLVYIGHSALWSFQERMALAAGIAPVWMGALLAASALGGVVGAAVGLKLGPRLGMTVPHVLAYGVLVGSALMLSGHLGMTGFALGAVVIKIAWFFGFPYLQGGISTLDPSGRWPSVAGALQSLGTAAGPALAALVVGRGYGPIIALAVLAYGLSAALALVTFHGISRSSEPDAVGSPKRGSRDRE